MKKSITNSGFLLIFLFIIGINKINAQGLPVVTTDSINSVTGVSAIGYLTRINNGGVSNTFIGFCYSTSPNPTTADSTLIIENNGLGSFHFPFSFLTANTTYYVKAYATDSAGTSYGTQLQFTTGNITLPTVISDSVNTITNTTAVIHGNVTNNGNDPEATAGFCYSTSPNPTIADSAVSANTFTISASFSKTISGLSPNTIYYVRAYSTNAAGTSYGSQLQFTTSTAATSATVTTDSVTSVTATSATLYGNLINTGNDPNIAAGFCYSTVVNPTIANTVIEVANITGSFSRATYSLTPNTTYYVRAYATNAAGTVYGSQLQFTSGAATLPSLTTDSVNTIATTYAVAYGTITNMGNDPNVTGGFCYSTAPNPTIADSTTGSISVVTGKDSSAINNLSPNTTYYVRAYATNAAGTVYGSQLQFTTGAATLPTVTTDSVTGVTATSATLYGNLINTGNDPNIAAGFCYSTVPNPTIANTVIEVANTTGSFSITTYSLTPNATYYVRAYATNAAGTVYGSQLQFTTGTATLATVTTDSVTNITTTSAIVYGTVTNNGGDPNVTGGFCYSTSPNPTIADSATGNVFFGTIGKDSSFIHNLTPNTTYYVRAYATNAAGTVYGSQLQFTTLGSGGLTSAAVTTDSVNTITGTTATAYGTVTNSGGDPNATVGFCYSTAPNPTVANSTTGVVHSGTGSFSTANFNLLPNTTYYVRAYVTNSVSTTYGNQLQFTTANTNSAAVTTDSVNSITATSATLYGNLISTGNDPNIAAGFCYGTVANPTIANTVIEVANTTGSFSITTYSLTPNTTYYVRTYATNVAGTVYGSQLQFTTEALVMPTVVTDSVNDISPTALNAYGNITNNGNDPNVTGGFCYSTSPNPTIADNTVNARIGTGYLSSNINGLSPNTNYYIRAYATNTSGTAYGSQLQFTTANATLPTVTTDSVNMITTTSAKFYGNITNNGKDSNVGGGFCYSTSPDPTIANTVISVVSGTGPFSVPTYSVTLSPNTTYYVRAYANNAVGTAYGSQIEFTTGEGDCFAHYSTSYDTVQNAFTLTVDEHTGVVAKSYLWNFGDGTTSTSPAPSHTYAANGIYNVCMKITVASGDSCTYCHNIGKDNLGNIYRSAGFSMTVENNYAKDVTGVESIDANINYSVYPNPTIDGKTTVLFDKPLTNATIQVISVAGVKVIEISNYSGSQIQLDISNQAAGVYIIEVVDDGSVYRTKLIKQ